MSTETLRIVHKVRYNEQTFLGLPPPSEPLKAASVRIRTNSIGLTSNNLSYCAGGTLLHWWHAFPVPASAPSGFTDAEYGVCPGWGYASVLASTIDAIEPGRTIYGFVPISSHTVDLQLQQSEKMPSHWIETSPHRSKLMSLYQRFFLLPSGFTLDAADMIALMKPVMVTAGSGYLLARYVFAHTNPIHPLGAPFPGMPFKEWTERESSLGKACVICVASGTKTARSFIYQIAALATDLPKFSLVEITNGRGCEEYVSPPFAHQVIQYKDICSRSLPKHSKYFVLDFGGRDNAAVKVVAALTDHDPSTEIIPIAIGSEPKVSGAEDRQMKMQQRNATSRYWWQMNATGIKDEAMKRMGEREYIEDEENAFQSMVKEQVNQYDGKVLGVKLRTEQGLGRELGVEGIWTQLCRGEITGEDGILVQL